MDIKDIETKLAARCYYTNNRTRAQKLGTCLLGKEEDGSASEPLATAISAGYKEPTRAGTTSTNHGPHSPLSINQLISDRLGTSMTGC